MHSKTAAVSNWRGVIFVFEKEVILPVMQNICWDPQGDKWQTVAVRKNSWFFTLQNILLICRCFKWGWKFFFFCDHAGIINIDCLLWLQSLAYIVPVPFWVPLSFREHVQSFGINQFKSAFNMLHRSHLSSSKLHPLLRIFCQLALRRRGDFTAQCVATACRSVWRPSCALSEQII